MTAPNSSSVRSSLRRLYGHLSVKRRWQLSGLACFMLIGAVAEMATLGAVIPFLSVLAGPNDGACLIPFFPCDLSLTEASILFVAVATVGAAIRISLLWVSNRFTFAVGADIGNEVYRRVLFQPYAYHVSHNTSDTIAGINKVNGVVQHVFSPLMQGCVSLILGLAIFVALLRVDAATATAAMLIFGSLYVVASALARRALRKNGKVISETEGLRIQTIQEGLGGIRDVLIDGAQALYAARFAKFNQLQRHAQASNSVVRSAPRYLIEACAIISMVVLAWWVGQSRNLAHAVPVLGALALGAQKLLPQLQQIYASWAAINGGHAALDHVLSLLDNKLEDQSGVRMKRDAASAGASSVNKGPAIALRNVSFQYDSDPTRVLVNVDFDIPSGSRIGIIGKTGSGKSTLIDLIMGLLEPTGGCIEIDGVALTAENKRAWHTRIAHVPQVVFLSDTSIAENIALGVDRSEIDIVRLGEVIFQAQLSDLIDSLENGYWSPVGERGVRLSGGQRQRIGLARALYKSADILVLDEATSALDDATEELIMRAIDFTGGGITVLSIAHRLGTLKNCDRIVELSEGKISRIGSYSEIVGK